MTPLLYNAPLDVPMWMTFGAVHMQDHIQIAAQIFDKTQILIPLLPLDPIPLDNPPMMLTWFMSHAAMHAAMNASMGAPGSDLSYVDFKNKEMMAVWIEYNALEHQAIAAALAAFQPQALPAQPMPQQLSIPALPGQGGILAPTQPVSIPTQMVQAQPVPEPVQSQPGGIGGLQAQPAGILGVQPQPNPAIFGQPAPGLLPQAAALPQTAPLPQSVPQPGVPAVVGMQPPGTMPPFIPTATA